MKLSKLIIVTVKHRHDWKMTGQYMLQHAIGNNTNYRRSYLYKPMPNVYSSKVPGNLLSQLEILSTGQTYYETNATADCINLHLQTAASALLSMVTFARHSCRGCYMACISEHFSEL